MRVENRQPSTVIRQPKWKKYLSLVLIFLISCTKDPGTPSGDLNGVYAGTYVQSGIVSSYAYIKLVFVGSNFSGEGTDSLRSICNGSYQITGDFIDFKNFCSTPDADLLLAGKYKIRTTGDSLYLSRDSLVNMLPNTELFSLKAQ